MSNNPHIDEVRQSLMDTLRDLRDRENPMDLERAKTVAAVASVLVDTAKVENEYIKITGSDKSSFLEIPHTGQEATPTAHNPFPNSTKYILK